jgi:uncharacterized protein YodC (DUF2158 family)
MIKNKTVVFPFMEGDLVKLKSGGPIMKIDKIRKVGGYSSILEYKCSWKDDKKWFRQRDWFHPLTIVKINNEEEKEFTGKSLPKQKTLVRMPNIELHEGDTKSNIKNIPNSNRPTKKPKGTGK